MGLRCSTTITTSWIGIAGMIALSVLLNGCTKSNSLSDASAAAGAGIAMGTGAATLNGTQRQLINKGVRQIIKSSGIDDGSARLVSLDSATSKQRGQTNICGYVRYKGASGQNLEQRYFVRLGKEGGTETTLMGQIANNTANTAKVKFMCGQAGLN